MSLAHLFVDENEIKSCNESVFFCFLGTQLHVLAGKENTTLVRSVLLCYSDAIIQQFLVIFFSPFRIGICCDVCPLCEQ